MQIEQVVVDLTAPVFGGSITWTREVIPRLCSLNPQKEYRLIIRPDLRWIEDFVTDNCRIITINIPQKFQTIYRLIWQQFRLPKLLRNWDSDILLSPFDVTALRASCKVVLGVQNASPYWGPVARSWIERIRLLGLRWLSIKSIKKSNKVFFVSEWSRSAISEITKIPLEKTSVAYNGVSSRFFPIDKENSLNEQAYILAVGSIYSYKDYTTLINAWAAVRKVGFDYLKLRIVGGIFDEVYHKNFLSILERENIQDSVSFIPELSPEQILGFYQKAKLFVFPSWGETFGLPLVEAMACGIPIVSSDLPVTREICKNAARYYVPGNVENLFEKIVEVLTNVSLQREMKEYGIIRARQYSWDAAAKQIQSILFVRR